MVQERTVRTPAWFGAVGLVAVVVVATVFGLMGVVGGTPPMPPAPAKVVVGTAAPAASNLAAWPDLRVTLPDASVRVRARFRMPQTGLAKVAYTGPLQWTADVGASHTLRLTHRDAVDLAVPRMVKNLRFVAPGCVPVEVTMPTAQEGLVELGDVDLLPTARLTFVVTGLPAACAGTATFAACSAEFAGSLDCAAGGQNGDATFPFLDGVDVSWGATLRGPHGLVQLSGREAALRPGEQRAVVVEAASVALRPCRLVGPSPQLLPHVAVRVLAAGVDPHGNEPTASFDDSGSCLLALGPSTTLALAGADGRELLAADTGTELQLRPATPLVGCYYGDANGAPVPFSCNQRPAVRVLVAERSQLQAFTVQVDGQPARRILVADLPTDRDWIDLARVPSSPLGELAVQVRAAAVPGRLLGLQVLDSHGTERAASLVAASPVLFAALEPGRYDVRFRVDGEPAAFAARGVEVGAGGRCEVAVDAPPAVVWTGEVIGQTTAPSAQRFHRVRLGGRAAGAAPSLQGGTWFSIDAAGSFTFSLSPGEVPTKAFDLRCVTMVLSASEVTIDPVRHHVVVRPPSDLRWVDLQIEPGEDTPWSAQLQRPGATEPWMMLWRREQRPIAVPPGAVFGGALFAHEPGGRQLGWFDVDGSLPRPVVRTRGGRTVTFRTDGKEARQVVLIGPRGQSGTSCTLAPGAEQQVFVPEGTRGYVLSSALAPGAEPAPVSIPATGAVVVP